MPSHAKTARTPFIFQTRQVEASGEQLKGESQGEVAASSIRSDAAHDSEKCRHGCGLSCMERLMTCVRISLDKCGLLILASLAAIVVADWVSSHLPQSWWPVFLAVLILGCFAYLIALREPSSTEESDASN